ncbi:MAG: OsmC family protein [Planctomycetota bacterium]
MVTIEAVYQGDLCCQAVHGPSGASLHTDAPRDNEGLGRYFSPTDLVATALGTCMLTILGIAARRRGLDLTGARVRVEKHMSSNPRRIGKLVARIAMPGGVAAEHRKALEQAAEACPVRASLHPDVELDLSFEYPAP